LSARSNGSISIRTGFSATAAMARPSQPARAELRIQPYRLVSIFLAARFTAPADRLAARFATPVTACFAALVDLFAICFAAPADLLAACFAVLADLLIARFTALADRRVCFAV